MVFEQTRPGQAERQRSGETTAGRSQTSRHGPRREGRARRGVSRHRSRRGPRRGGRTRRGDLRHRHAARGDMDERGGALSDITTWATATIRAPPALMAVHQRGTTTAANAIGTTWHKKQKQLTKKGRDSSAHLHKFRRAVCQFLARRAAVQRGSSGRRWMQGAGGTLGTAVHAHFEATASFSTATPPEPPKQGQPLPVHPVPLRPSDVFTFSSLVPPRQGKPLLLLPKHL